MSDKYEYFFVAHFFFLFLGYISCASEMPFFIAHSLSLPLFFVGLLFTISDSSGRYLALRRLYSTIAVCCALILLKSIFIVYLVFRLGARAAKAARGQCCPVESDQGSLSDCLSATAEWVTVFLGSTLSELVFRPSNRFAICLAAGTLRALALRAHALREARPAASHGYELVFLYFIMAAILFSAIMNFFNNHQNLLKVIIFFFFEVFLLSLTVCTGSTTLSWSSDPRTNMHFAWFIFFVHTAALFIRRYQKIYPSAAAFRPLASKFAEVSNKLSPPSLRGWGVKVPSFRIFLLFGY